MNQNDIIKKELEKLNNLTKKLDLLDEKVLEQSNKVDKLVIENIKKQIEEKKK